MFKAFILFAILLPVSCQAQFTITGRVLNQADKMPVADASVFFNNATIGDKTAQSGSFTLQGVSPGKYDLVVSIVGFETYHQAIQVSSNNINLPAISISPKTIALKEVTVKVNHNREQYLELFYERFKNEFLGTSETAKQCKILNPELLALDYDEGTGRLTGSSADFLEIENDALGYKLKYLLTNFKHDSKTLHYEGPVLFIELHGTAAQEHKWQQERRAVYRGSLMHFLRSAVDDNLEENGFRVYQLATYANPQRLPDSLIAAKLKTFYSMPTVHADSIAVWKRESKRPRIVQTLLPFVLTKVDIITGTDQPGIFALGCDTAKLLIMYNRNHNYPPLKPLQDIGNLFYILNNNSNKEVTLVSLKTPYAFFDNNGRVMDPNSLEFIGDWARNRVAELLPVNYREDSPTADIYADTLVKSLEHKAFTYSINNPAEKVHLHLDRPWYGLGDTIWFKAYTVAGENHQLSQLSGVLYTELINEQDSVVKRLTLKLDSGISNGDFVLPYSYKAGTYRIRAYTNWMRNDSAFFYDRAVIIGGIAVTPGTKQTTSVPLANKLAKAIAGNIDIQFFPEGGYLVNGLRSKVAFKAIDKNGISENIQGTVTDQDGNEVASFNTLHAGMGEFPLVPEAGKQYKAKIIRANGDRVSVNLPEAKISGFTLTINNTADSIYVKVAANDAFYKNNQSSTFYLVAQSAGGFYYSASDKLVNDVFTTVLNKNRFPMGIVQFTLFSQSGEPLNERNIFVKNGAGLKLALATLKESYAPNEKANINLEARNEDGKPVTGTFSVAVTDETKVPADEQAEPTILTDLLLTSELKGNIEKPNYYFINESNETRIDLDLLMLTQGYSRFEWKKVLATGNTSKAFNPEVTLSLSGTIKTPSNKPVPNGKVQLTSIKDHLVIDTLTDANGDFTFTGIDLADTSKVIINAKKAKGSNNVKIYVKEPAYPGANNIKNRNYPGSSISSPVRMAMEQTYKEAQQYLLKRTIELNEVKISAHKRSPAFQPLYSENMNFSANLNGPGNANQVLLGEKLVGCTKLSDCLRGKLFGVEISGTGIPYSIRASARSFSGSRPMAVIVEGMQFGPDELDNINASDVYSIEVLTSISYLSMYGSNAPNGALIITLKRGAGGINNANIAVDGLITYKFLGYYKAREFYTPKYSVDKPSLSPDNRKTIYWNPDIVTGTDGKASFGFFNSGSKATYRVVIEGIDVNGNLGRQQYRYKVE